MCLTLYSHDGSGSAAIEAALVLAGLPHRVVVAASVVSRWSGSRPHLRAQRPALAALLDRVQAHALVGPVLDRHFPPAPPAA